MSIDKIKTGDDLTQSLDIVSDNISKLKEIFPEVLTEGKIDFKVDKFGIIHAGVGKVSFTPEQIHENVKELILTISKLKPSSSKGTYFKSIHLSSTMSPGISVDKGSIQGI